MGRQQTQTDDQRVLQGLEIILVNAGIHDVQKDGRDLSTPGQCVLDRRVLCQQLCREVCVGDVAVVRGELVAMQTEWANPEFAAGVNLASGQQDRIRSRWCLTQLMSSLCQSRLKDWLPSNSPVGVEDGTAGVLLACNGLVVDQRQVLALLERGVQGGDGHDCPRGLEAGRGPRIEREADSILVFDFLKVHGETMASRVRGSKSERRGG